MFDWLFSQEIRLWIFVAVCVIAILVVAASSLIGLTVEAAVSSIFGLATAAEYGFFMGFVVFTLLFLGLYIYLGRPAKVVEA